MSSKSVAPGKKSASPRPSNLKRKPLTTPAPPPKRKKATESSAKDDPTRKYCLDKLQDVFDQIFLKYPFVDVQGGDGEVSKIEKKTEELTEEDRTLLKDEGTKFAIELEQCMYDIYSEPDKQGRPSASGKYKCVFRRPIVI